MSRFLCVGVRPRILPVLCLFAECTCALVRSDSEELDALTAGLHLFLVCILAFIALYTYVGSCDTNFSMSAYGCIVLHVDTTGTSSCHGLTSCGPLSWCPPGLGQDSKFAMQLLSFCILQYSVPYNLCLCFMLRVDLCFLLSFPWRCGRALL